MLRRAAHQKSQYSQKLAAQQEWIETRLAREIERTDLMQSEMSNMKTKFAAHLQHLHSVNEEEQAAHAADAESMQLTLQV